MKNIVRISETAAMAAAVIKAREVEALNNSSKIYVNKTKKIITVKSRRWTAARFYYK